MMYQSLDEFAEAMRNAIPKWAMGDCADNSDPVNKSFNQKEVCNTMNIEKKERILQGFVVSKLTPEELAVLDAIEKKYGTAEPGAAVDGVAKAQEPPELHPEVKKALEENKAMATRMEELQKSLEIKDLTITAAKYEVLGKKADELATKLYGMKKSGGTVYDDYVALLDEQLTMVEKGGLFGEVGTSRSGSAPGGTELMAKVAEIRKANGGMGEAEAFAKAYEENPALAAKYEQEYMNGRAN
jgi:hypothetical protein